MRACKLILILALTAAVSEQGAAVEISRLVDCHGGDVLRLRGSIENGDYVKFRSYFGNRRIVGLDLHSAGGSLDEGVRIAALTRQKRLSTFVGKECDSACAFIFLLGAKRYANKDARIGVHSVGNDYGNEDNGTIRDTVRFARLFAKFGIPSSTIGKMVATPPGKITFLDQTDLSALKAIVRNPFARKSGAGNDSCSPDPTAVALVAPREPSAVLNKSVSGDGKRSNFARSTDTHR
jgi:hypothetical protein